MLRSFSVEAEADNTRSVTSESWGSAITEIAGCVGSDLIEESFIIVESFLFDILVCPMAAQTELGMTTLWVESKTIEFQT